MLWDPWIKHDVWAPSIVHSSVSSHFFAASWDTACEISIWMLFRSYSILYAGSQMLHPCVFQGVFAFMPTKQQIKMQSFSKCPFLIFKVLKTNIPSHTSTKSFNSWNTSNRTHRFFMSAKGCGGSQAHIYNYVWESHPKEVPENCVKTTVSQLVQLENSKRMDRTLHSVFSITPTITRISVYPCCNYLTWELPRTAPPAAHYGVLLIFQQISGKTVLSFLKLGGEREKNPNPKWNKKQSKSKQNKKQINKSKNPKCRRKYSNYCNSVK